MDILVKGWRRSNVAYAFCLSSMEHLVRVETSHAIRQLLLFFPTLIGLMTFNFK